MAALPISVRPAVLADVPFILTMIRELAEYEKLLHEVEATEELIRKSLFGPQIHAEAIIGSVGDDPVGFALFFQNFSTFLGKPGIYLEDLYVRPQFRSFGLGKRLLKEVAAIAVERGCGRYEWSVLDWNAPAIDFYESLGAVMHSEWRRMLVDGEALGKMATLP